MKGIESGVGQRNGATVLSGSWGAPVRSVHGSELDGGVGAFKDEAQADPDDEYVPGELLVKFKDDVSDDDIKDSKKAVTPRSSRTSKGLGIGHWKLGERLRCREGPQGVREEQVRRHHRVRRANYYGLHR